MTHDTHDCLSRKAKAQSVSPLAPLGVEAVLDAKANPAGAQPRHKIFDEFVLTDRVALVSGGNRGLGLEMAIALCEAGARAVYCFDLPEEPSEEFIASREYVGRLGNNSRLEYFAADVRNQELLQRKAKELGDKEQRMDICIAAAGILRPSMDCLEYSGHTFREVRSYEENQPSLIVVLGLGHQCDWCFLHRSSCRPADGTFWPWGEHYTHRIDVRKYHKQGRIMEASPGLGNTEVLQDLAWVSYNSSKAAVLQMARSMACELGPKKIRVNSLSPGYIYTQ